MNETIVVRGRIHPTVSPGIMWEEMRFRDGLIIAGGARQETGLDELVRDYGSATVLPAFTDSHIHLLDLALSLRQVDLGPCRSLRETQDRIAEAFARRTAPRFLMGYGWDINRWGEREFPTAADLDVISDRVPIVMVSHDGHLRWVNSETLRRGGITAATPPPAGGIIVKDPRGHPTGILMERATLLLEGLVPSPSPQEWRDWMEEALRHLHAFGITAVHDFSGQKVLPVLRQLEEENRLSTRVVAHLVRQELDACPFELNPGEYSRVGGLKLFADGALSSRTAWMWEPYAGENNRGVPVLAEEELDSLGQMAMRLGLTVRVHAVGDRAIRLLADVWMKRKPPRYSRVEHAQIPSPDDIPRLHRCGVALSVQPAHLASDRVPAARFLGDRGRWLHPYRSFWEEGFVLAFGSDAPIESPNPFAALAAAVGRGAEQGQDPWYPEEGLSLAEALQAYTLGGPASVGELEQRGTLEIGKEAHYVVLDEPRLFELSSPELARLKVKGTYFEGQPVSGFEAEPSRIRREKES